MARDISELGADVIDDSPKQIHRISPKKRNYIIGLSIAGVLLVGAITGTVIACNTILLDYSNLSNVTYYYNPKSLLAEGEEPTAVLYRLKSNVKYPSTFRIPNQVQGYKVVGVADGAFVGHSEIKKVIMPNSLEFVGENAFKNCTSLATFSWSKRLADVGVDAFENTAFLNNLKKDPKKLYPLPSGLLIYVGKNYFDPNTALVSDSLSEAEENAIKSNYQPSKVVKFSTLNVDNISSGVFKNNDKICYIDLPEHLDEISNSTFENCINLLGIDGSHCGLTVIKKRAFADCTKLSDIDLPKGLKVLGEEAFANTALTDTIPDVSAVESLGERVFADCEQLTTATYNGTYLPNYFFSGCSSLSSFYWGEGNSNIDKVTSIGVGAFEGTGFETFVMPKNISIINDETFKNAKSLEKVSLWGNFNYILNTNEEEEIPEDEEEEEGERETFITYEGEEREGVLAGVNSIRASAFEGCEMLRTIDLYDDHYAHHKGDVNQFTFPASLTRTDGKTTVSGSDNHVFSNSAMRVVNLSANLRNIGSYAFSDSLFLEEVKIDYPSLSRMTRIRSAAFENCIELREFDLPQSLDNLGSSTFMGCVKLENVGLGDTAITAINSETFYDCEALETLDIPETVTVLKSNAFYKNYKLNYLVVPRKVSEVQTSAFMEMRKTSEEDPMPVYFDFLDTEAQDVRKINFSGGFITGQNWHDDSIIPYFKLADGAEKQSGINYWDGNKADPHVI